MLSYWVAINRLAVFLFLSFLFLCFSVILAYKNSRVKETSNWFWTPMESTFSLIMGDEGVYGLKNVSDRWLRDCSGVKLYTWYKLDTTELCVFTPGNGHSCVQLLDSSVCLHCVKHLFEEQRKWSINWLLLQNTNHKQLIDSLLLPSLPANLLNWRAVWDL